MSTTLTTLAMFDDLRRCQEILIDGTAEEEFLKFVQMHEQFRLHWMYTIQESQRLQRELDASLQNMADLETKLFHARRLLEMENKTRKEAEHERDQIEKKMIAVRDLLRNDNHIREETRDKFAFLDTFARKRKSGTRAHCDEINSTGSLLSDFSLTQSEDDFLDVKPCTKGWKKHRPSRPSNAGTCVGGRKSRVSCEGKRRSVADKPIEIGMSDKIVAHTKVSIPPPGDGPIVAESTIQSVPQKIVNTRCEEVTSPKRRSAPKTPKTPKTMFTPTAPPMQESNLKATPTFEVKKNIMRSHTFGSKTFLKTDTCINCQKRIRFGSVALKCRDCKICVHPDCKEVLSIACVPQSAGTPIVRGTIDDYAPSTGPRVPGLIVHCVNEIETRGLKEEGIYRVCGSERQVKMLKEKFLRGKGISFLADIDIHVLSGCIKDFLRSLREPLIPTELWREFANAVENVNQDKAMSDLYRAIDLLPQANRDTLAFLIQHFQRIAVCEEIKMPLQNIARVFGPTIVGYSSSEPDQHAILTETRIQYNVMENLMKIPTDYWNQFVNFEMRQDKEVDDSVAKSYYGTPLRTPLKKHRKFYGTPPYTLKKQ